MARRDRAWRPVLVGGDAESAVAVVGQIADAMAAHLREAPNGPAGLAGGAAGVALFYAYLSRATGESSHSELAAQFADLAIEAADRLDAADGPHVRSLAVGLPGIAWAMEHLRGRLWAADEVLNESTDEVVRELLARGAPALPRYELLYGVAGYGVYALERAAHDGDVALAAQVLSVLEARASKVSAGLTWLTPAALAMQRERGHYPEGVFDLGVAHGVAGVIGLLASLHRIGGVRPRVERLLVGAISWLRSQRLADRSRGHYPFSVAPPPSSHVSEPARAGWCWGDAGIALALLRAAVVLKDDALEEEAVALVGSPGDEIHGVDNAGLCHGAAGLALIFARMAQCAPDAVALTASARRWAKTTLAMQRPGTGIAGYAELKGGSHGAEVWRPSAGLLGGAAGVGLALLALATEHEPCWDRCLLLSGSDTP